eukprot:gene17072-8590_t
MDDMETDAACAILIVCALRMKRKKIRKVWCKEWLQKREDTSLYTGLVSELRLADREDYRRFMRMNTTTFEVIYDVLKDDYFSVPSSEQEWINLADATEKRWQFPNAFAAADGKHIAVYHPDNSGGTFYNYKGFYSIVLLAFVDYDYKFIYADVGCQGFADEVVDDNVIDGQWREGNTGSFLEPLPARLKGNKPKVSAEKIREIFAEHFYGPGEVPWQWKCLV